MMPSVFKKIKRNKKKRLEKKMQKQISMFTLLPDNCLACGKDYDKNNKEIAMKWVVKVYQDEERVDLLCPDCMEKENV